MARAGCGRTDPEPPGGQATGSRPTEVYRSVGAQHPRMHPASSAPALPIGFRVVHHLAPPKVPLLAASSLARATAPPRIDHCVIAVFRLAALQRVLSRRARGRDRPEGRPVRSLSLRRLAVQRPRTRICRPQCRAAPVQLGNSDLCFVLAGPDADRGSRGALAKPRHRQLVAGPGQSDSGAGGQGWHVYFHDPDGSLLEFMSYSEA